MEWEAQTCAHLHRNEMSIEEICVLISVVRVGVGISLLLPPHMHLTWIDDIIIEVVNC